MQAPVVFPSFAPRTVWVLLVFATGLTFSAGEFGHFGGATGRALIVGVLALAVVKGALVALDFMELRHAPALWRRIVLGWLLLVGSGIVFAYLK